MNPEGRLLHNRYQVLSQIGSGGQASVWLAEDTLLERRVALKELVPHAQSIDLEESRARALIEARALARVRHRCIVRVHDIFLVGPDPWIVMEYICGSSLADIVKRKPLTEYEIAAIGLSVLDGLQAVHAARIVHRDVKPANILVDQDGAVFLVDFGIAKIAEDAAGADRDGSITGRGRVIGTPEYLAPEQFYGFPATPASDLWALGVTLYYAMAGHTPFARASAQPVHDLRSAILYEDPPPSGRGPLVALILRLLAKNPATRPGMEEVSQALESILAGRSRNGSLPGTVRRSTPALPTASKTLVYTDAIASTEAIRPVDYAERARYGIADAVRDVNASGADSGMARLLAKPDAESARILNNCSPEVAAELIAGMAASHVGKAGNILQMLSVTRSGKVLDYMPSAASAEVVAALPERRQQVRVLSQADVRTVAEVVMELMDMQSELAVLLVAALPEQRAGAVLNEVKPATVAGILQAQSPDLRARLLQALSPEFRALVRRAYEPLM